MRVNAQPKPSQAQCAKEDYDQHGPDQCVGGQPVEFGVKTRTSRRTVELDQATVDLLGRWRRRLQRDGLPCGIDDWMFCNPTGRYLNPQSLTQLFDRIVRGSDLPRIRFHDLRHTHASLLVASGESIKVVSERLGHAHPAFTIHTYQHLLPGMSAAAADRFATMIATANRWTSTGTTGSNTPGQRPRGQTGR